MKSYANHMWVMTGPHLVYAMYVPVGPINHSHSNK